MRSTGRTDHAELVELLHEQGDALLRFSTLLTGSRADGEDVFQDAVVSVLRAWPRVQPETAGAYLRKAIINKSLDQRRRRSRNLIESKPRAQNDARMLRVDSDEDFFAMLRVLPDGQRAVLVLRFYLDWSEREVANALGCSIGNVKSQSSRGVAALRIALDRHDSSFHLTEGTP
jgi:RNA polymerase sigma-70 factor (sigma-E family)